jgi:hypothetical protein
MARPALLKAAYGKKLIQDGLTFVPLVDATEVAALLDALLALREPASPPSTIVDQPLTYRSTAHDADADYRGRAFSTNGTLSPTGFKRRHAMARRWRRVFGTHEPGWIYEALPGFS